MVEKFEKFENFDDLYQFLLKIKKPDDQSGQRKMMPMCQAVLMNNSRNFLFEHSNMLELITSFDELLDVIKAIPVLAEKFLLEKSDLIITINQLIELKRYYPFLTDEFMLEKAAQVDMESDLDIQCLPPEFSFLIKPLMQRQENVEKVRDVMAYMEIVKSVPELKDSLLENRGLRDNIRIFSDLSMVLQQAPSWAERLFREERLRELVHYYFDIEDLAKIDCDIVLKLFQYESVRKKFQATELQFSIFCYIKDDYIPKLLDLLYGGDSFTKEVFGDFGLKQLQNYSERNVRVMQEIKEYFENHSNQNKNKLRR